MTVRACDRARHCVEMAAVLMFACAAAAHAQRPGPPGAAFTEGRVVTAVDAVMIHPIVAAPFACSEHGVDPADPVILGDAAGADCTVIEYDTQPSGRRPPRYFRNDGSRNEDWIGWGEALLAPFDGVVEEIQLNPVTNTPGTPGQGPSSFIVFRRADGVRVVYGHIADPRVAEGAEVASGQPVAAVGNNGFGYMPHTHVGAWTDDLPVQVRFDLRALAALRRPSAGQ
jgi:hypothetical protein